MRLFCLFCASLCFLACEGFYQAPPHPDPGTTAKPAPASNKTAEEANGAAKKQPESEWGVVKCDSTPESSQFFNESIQYFFSTTEKWNTVPYINCSGSKRYTGGMWIKGQAVFSDRRAALDLSDLDQDLEISDSSFLEIHIVDSTGKAWQIKMQGEPHGSELKGKNALLTFADKKGEVYLDGRIEGRLFKGIFEFKNFARFDGGRPESQSRKMGDFAIPACSLFKCAGAAASSSK